MEGASLRLEEGPPGDEESKASKKQRKDEQRRRTRARQAFLLVFLVAILLVSKLAAPAPARKQVPGAASRHGALQHEEGRGAPAWHSQHPSNWTSSSGGRPKVTDAAGAFSRWVDAGSFAAASHSGGGGEHEGSAAARGPAEAALDAKCYGEDGAEYDGAGVAMWGKDNIQPDSAACCASCRTHRSAHPGRSGCAVWVFCASAVGCGGPKRGECWGKTRSQSLLPVVRSRGQGWVSGALLSDAEATEVAAARAAGEAERAARRERPTNPRVFLDVSINGGAASRMEFVLYATEAPRAAENFRAMCTGEKGGKLTFSGMRFYRIIDQFIDQAGVNGVGSIWGSSFDDDPGGLALRHDRAGLLSAANSGPDSNSGHFSVVVSPAPHLDGSYTIFGEVVAGHDTMMAINKLSAKESATGTAVVAAAGCLAACEPRPSVGPRCARRTAEESVVQGRKMHKCAE